MSEFLSTPESDLTRCCREWVLQALAAEDVRNNSIGSTPIVRPGEHERISDVSPGPTFYTREAFMGVECVRVEARSATRVGHDPALHLVGHEPHIQEASPVEASILMMLRPGFEGVSDDEYTAAASTFFVQVRQPGGVETYLVSGEIVGPVSFDQLVLGDTEMIDSQQLCLEGIGSLHADSALSSMSLLDTFLRNELCVVPFSSGGSSVETTTDEGGSTRVA